jgi:ABC-type polysaccharide/polyol phosphate transport system ATPase subunit
MLMKFVRDSRAAFRQPKQKTFWVMDNVSLKVKEGEVPGLIGRMGRAKRRC